MDKWMAAIHGGYLLHRSHWLMKTDVRNHRSSWTAFMYVNCVLWSPYYTEMAVEKRSS